jgi:hypothetical protein
MTSHCVALRTGDVDDFSNHDDRDDDILLTIKETPTAKKTQYKTRKCYKNIT